MSYRLSPWSPEVADLSFYRLREGASWPQDTQPVGWSSGRPELVVQAPSSACHAAGGVAVVERMLEEMK